MNISITRFNRFLFSLLLIGLSLVTLGSHALAHLIDGNSPLVLPVIEVEIVVENDGVHSRVHIPLRIFLEDVLKIEVPAERIKNSDEADGSFWEAEALKVYRSLDPDEVYRQISEQFVKLKHIGVQAEGQEPLPPPDASNLEIQIPKFKDAPEEGPKSLKFSAVQFDLKYKTPHPPTQVSIVWQLFPTADEKNSPLNQVKKTGNEFIVVQFEAEGKNSLIVLQKKEPEYIWHSESTQSSAFDDVLKQGTTEGKKIALPITAIILIGLGLGVALKRKTVKGNIRGVLTGIFLALAIISYATKVGSVTLKIDPNNSLGQLSEEKGLKVFRALLQNIYKAFDYTSDREIYKTLAQSVDGPLLEEIFKGIYDSLILHEDGGAVCRIREVKIIQLRWEGLSRPTESDNEYSILATWRVHGLVKHWGHTHEKSQQFKARFKIAPRQGSWKIIDQEILEQRKIDPQTPIPPQPNRTGQTEVRQK